MVPKSKVKKFLRREIEARRGSVRERWNHQNYLAGCHFDIQPRFRDWVKKEGDHQ